MGSQGCGRDHSCLDPGLSEGSAVLVGGSSPSRGSQSPHCLCWAGASPARDFLALFLGSFSPFPSHPCAEALPAPVKSSACPVDSLLGGFRGVPGGLHVTLRGCCESGTAATSPPSTGTAAVPPPRCHHHDPSCHQHRGGVTARPLPPPLFPGPCGRPGCSCCCWGCPSTSGGVPGAPGRLCRRRPPPAAATRRWGGAWGPRGPPTWPCWWPWGGGWGLFFSACAASCGGAGRRRGCTCGTCGHCPAPGNGDARRRSRSAAAPEVAPGANRAGPRGEAPRACPSSCAVLVSQEWLGWRTRDSKHRDPQAGPGPRGVSLKSLQDPTTLTESEEQHEE
ncbi:cuticle collagen 40-like [Corvus moneduloides]|uniref:cuticle collagen 40-like n=1 Tax=Corvus moneduloides TaxID=1196302 RepID=UPI0013622D18|nr:cuticle collagen 40-like [Corvus moneduloides]